MDIFFYSQCAGYVVDEGACRYLPVDVHDLLERLLAEQGVAAAALEDAYRRLCGQARDRVAGLREEAVRCYRPFSPDRHQLMFRDRAPSPALEGRFLAAFRELLGLACFEPLDRAVLEGSLTRVSPFGLNLRVDLADFELLDIYSRGRGIQVDWRRHWRTLFLRRERVEYPVFRRLVLVFKLKSQEALIQAAMAREGLTRREAARRVRRRHPYLPRGRVDQYLHIKLFKDTPRDDLEMFLPNRGVRMKLFDRIKLAVTGLGSVGAGLFTAVKKLFFAVLHPTTLVMTLGGFGGIVVQQVMKFLAQRNEYLKYLSQKLYTHSLASNRAVIGRVAERAAEEQVKEALLAWYLLQRSWPPVEPEPAALEAAMAGYLRERFGVETAVAAGPALALLAETGLLAGALRFSGEGGLQ